MASDLRAKFQQACDSDSAASIERERIARETAAKREASKGGVTKIGSKKGQASALTTLFEAKAQGDDVELFDRRGGWESKNVSSAASGKWEGGAAGMGAKVVKKEEPKGPPPKKNINEFL
eukprot:TRINITY_DN220_c0_g1_i1.p1 TRINITY_DN220_c0_g1~~TRINITY_DN220_c0_g1_i1.p1  ORF type:complete len:120 (+),score=88.05 TRINITY_DN220_c0_g1_i1:120-479(+)